MKVPNACLHPYFTSGMRSAMAVCLAVALLLRAVPAADLTSALFNVSTYGAKGDGLANDTAGYAKGD